MQSILRDLMLRQSYRIIESNPPIPATLPREERLRLLVEQRASMFEIIGPIQRAAVLQETTSQMIATLLETLRETKRTQVLNAFAPELSGMPLVERRVLSAALCAAASWAAWETLRAHQRLSVPGAKRAVTLMLESLLRGTKAPAPAKASGRTRARKGARAK
jgi:hypothetical protein